MERARAEWQTGPPRGHGVVTGSLAAVAVVAGPAPHTWPAWQAGCSNPEGWLRSWAPCCFWGLVPRVREEGGGPAGG